MRTHLRCGWMIAAGLSCLWASAAAAQLDDNEFVKLHRALKPAGETWKTIPWHTNLISAQNQAAREQKLLFVWAMDGHPLGCT